MGGNKGSWSETRVTQWAHGLGEERHARDASVVLKATAEREDAARTTAASVVRWAGIVASIRRLVDAYNTGAQRPILNVVEQSGQLTVTVTAAAEGTPSLTAALEDTLICVQACDALGVSHAAEVRLRPDRSDVATAAYVLQNWMQRLDPTWSAK
jgi:hypothetical protein